MFDSGDATWPYTVRLSGSQEGDAVITVTAENTSCEYDGEAMTVEDLGLKVYKDGVETENYEVVETSFKVVLTAIAGVVDGEGLPLEPGSYTITVKVTVDGEDIGIGSFGWTIDRRTLYVGNYQWVTVDDNGEIVSIDNNPDVYDGTQKTRIVTGLPEEITVKSYTNNVQTYAGTYTITPNFEYDSKHYDADLPYGLRNEEWIIAKAEVTADEVKWDYTQALAYNGKQQEVSLVGLPSFVIVNYGGNSAKDVGEYSASATIVGSELYEIINYKELTLTWSIVKAKIEVPTAGELTYTGAAQDFVLVARRKAITKQGPSAFKNLYAYKALSWLVFQTARVQRCSRCCGEYLAPRRNPIMRPLSHKGSAPY